MRSAVPLSAPLGSSINAIEVGPAVRRHVFGLGDGAAGCGADRGHGRLGPGHHQRLDRHGPAGSAFSFTVQTTGLPDPSLTESGTLPTGVTFTDNGDGTATLAGTPGAGTGGSYPITLTAANQVDSPATQSFTLVVNQPPAITSATSVADQVGSPLNFTVTTSGYPTARPCPSPGPARRGQLHRQRQRHRHPGRYAEDAGAAAPTISPSARPTGWGPRPASPSPCRSEGSPVITSAASTSFQAGHAGTFTVTTNGLPAPTLSESGPLPAGVTFTNNGNGTATLAGTPGAGTEASYSISITAANGVGSPATQSFTLVVAINRPSPAPTPPRSAPGRPGPSP